MQNLRIPSCCGTASSPSFAYMWSVFAFDFMYCRDHLFIEWLVSSCCITVILIGCLNFMSFLSKDVGCSISAKFHKLLTSFASICFCLWQSHCRARSPMATRSDLDHSLCSQKTGPSEIHLLTSTPSWLGGVYLSKDPRYSFSQH